MLVLEVGSGKRPMAGASISAVGNKIIKTDINKKAYVDVICDAQSLPFRNDVFDYLFCSHVLEHIPEYIKAFREFHRVLRGGRTIEIIVPHWSGPTALMDPTHLHLFSARRFSWIAKRGLAEEDNIYVSDILDSSEVALHLEIKSIILTNIPSKKEKLKDTSLCFRIYIYNILFIKIPAEIFKGRGC